MKRSVTKEVEQAVKAIAERYRGGEIDTETFFVLLKEALYPITKSIVASFSRQYYGFVDPDELAVIADEGIYHIATHYDPTQEIKLSYIRKCINGYLKSHARKIAFVTRTTLSEEVPQRVHLSVLEELQNDDEDEISEDERIPELIDKNWHNEFDEMEYRDWMKKRLSPDAYEVFRLLDEGYTPAEVKKELLLSQEQFNELVREIMIEVDAYRMS